MLEAGQIHSSRLLLDQVHGAAFSLPLLGTGIWLNPDTGAGDSMFELTDRQLACLLAHELAHVIQFEKQRSARQRVRLAVVYSISREYWLSDVALYMDQAADSFADDNVTGGCQS
jgi:hypothetical protein